MRCIELLLSVYLAFPLLVNAAEPAAEELPARPALAQSPISTSELVNLTLALLAVLVVIFALAWMMRRFGNFSVAANGALRILGGMSLGARERIVLVQVGEEQLVLGIAPGRVQTLHVLTEASRVPVNDRPAQAGVFAERLAAVMKRQK
jgi:flagellar protein FliO/FliZ